jgi:ArsR family transcriptional regulator, cadmium/lead-responsive transcriptional repressor
MWLTTEKSDLALKAKLFRGFSDPSRLGLIEALREGPLTVGQLVEATGLSQSNTSNHLACLRDCGLVAAEQQGRSVLYRLSDPRIEEILTLCEALLSDVGATVYACTRYDQSVNQADR